MIQAEKVWVKIPKRGKDAAAQIYTEYLRKEGTDRQSIIFLPGGPGLDHQNYKHDHIFLADDYDLIFWDPRGCGKSKEIDFSTYSIETYVDDVVSICRYYNLQQVTVIGVSFGAIAALPLSIKYPEIVQKLVLVVGACSHHFLEKAIKNLEKRGTQEQQRLAKSAFLGELSKEEFDNYFEVMGSLYSHRIALGENVESPPGNFNYKVTNHAWKTYMKELDFRGDLHKIKCETAVFAGAKDWVCDVTESHFLAEKIPNSQLHVFEDASHMLALDVKDQYEEKISEFLKL